MDAVEYAKDLALRYLNRRMRSRREVELYLRRKDVIDDDRDRVVDDLLHMGVIDDAAYARAFTRDRVRLRPKGYMLISRELAGRGVAREVIDSAIREVEATFPEDDVAADLLARRERQYSVLPRDEAEVKARRWLASRGFRHASVRAAIEGAEWMGASGTTPDDAEAWIADDGLGNTR